MAALLAGAASILSGCTSLDLLNTPPPAGMTTTGKYPSLGTPLKAAGPEMSDQEASAMASDIGSLAPKNKDGGAATEAEYQRKLKEMQKLKDEQGNAGQN